MTLRILTSRSLTRASHNKKMAPPKLRHGIGANCSVLIKRLHPAKLVADKFPNLAHGRRLSDLICLREEEKMVTRKLQTCFVYRHQDFEGKELHAVRRWSQVESEGSDTQIFGLTNNPVDAEVTDTEEEPEIRLEIPTFVRNAGNRAEDIAEVRALGLWLMTTMNPPQRTYLHHKTTTTKLLMAYSGDGVALTTGSRQMVSNLGHASIVFLELRCKARRC
jgi:hypothetical protein